MFDASIGPSSAAPSVALSRNALLTAGIVPGDVIFKSAKIDVARCFTLTTASNFIVHAATETLVVGGCNIETEFFQVETDRLTPAGLTGANFFDGGIPAAKVAGRVPVSMGGTSVASFTFDGLVVGAGGSAPLAATAGLAFDPSSGTLEMAAASGGVRFAVDPNDASAGHFDLGLEGGVPTVSTPTGLGGPIADSGGIVPAVTGLSVTDATDSNAVLNYEVVDQDNDQKSLYIAWYNKAADFPKDAEEIIAGTGSVGFKELDVSTVARSDTVLDGLGPISEYVVRCVADDFRGNVSIPRRLDFRTTEFGDPVIVAAAGLVVTSAGEVRFSASNEPDSSSMSVFAGTFLAANTRTAAELFADLLATGFEGLFVSSIPANTASNVAVSITRYRNAGDLAAAAVTIQENKTYYPFYLLVDAESNATLCNLPPAFFGEPPTWAVLPAQTTAFFASEIEAAWRAEDNKGIRTVLTHVGSHPVPFATLLQAGESNDAVATAVRLTRDNERGNVAIEHTTDYVVTVAAVDTSGLCNVVSFNAKTLDNVRPAFAQFAVASVGTSARVTWDAQDRSGISGVFLRESSEAVSPLPAPTGVKANATSVHTAAAGSVVLSNTPSWCNTYIFGVAEDNATDYMAPANLLSFVSGHTIHAPKIATGSLAQLTGLYDVVSTSFQTTVETADATAYFTLVDPGAPTGPGDLSNLIFTNIADVSTGEAA